MLYVFILTFLVVLIFGLVFNLVRPIFEFVHYLIVNFFQSLGISYMGARAITSVVIIVIIIIILF